jgi:hypothetical protein
MRTVSWLLVIAALGLGVSHAFAGESRSGSEVLFFGNEQEGSARGQLAAVRNSGDPTQYIGCTFQSNGPNEPRLAQCQAVNDAGEYRQCTTSEPAKLDTLLALQPTSQLVFAWNKQGDCTHVMVDNFSYYQPLAP